MFCQNSCCVQERALVRMSEKEYRHSAKMILHKMSIALKECNETCYWLELLHETDYLTDPQFDSIYKESQELLRILISIVKTAKTQ